MAMLELQNVHSYYEHIHALKGVTLAVDQGEIVTLIGANGAGKTTALNTISGLVRPREGKILLDGEPISGMLPHRIVVKGVGHSPEGRKIFPRLTVTENLMMGAYTRTDAPQIAQDLKRVFDIFPKLLERRYQAGGILSGGEQQMLAIGRAMMSRPRLLLLDEPSMGLAPVLVETIFKTIQRLNAEGVTILLVEQNAAKALQIAHRGYVIETGRIVLHDRAESLRRNETVRKVYLGEN